MLRHRYRVGVKTRRCLQRLGRTQDRVATQEPIRRRTLVVTGRCHLCQATP
jgi:hypothetical protein